MLTRSFRCLAVLTLCVLATGAWSCSSGGDTDAEVSKPKAAFKPIEEFPQTPQPSRAANRGKGGEELAASHILISYSGAPRGIPGVTRTKEEALETATGLAERAQGGEGLEKLATSHSDGPTRTRGGNLGIFDANRTNAVFANAVKGLEVGEISDPVETEFGYHVIRRNEVERIAARHILVSYEGCEGAPSSITRTKEQARAQIDEVRRKAEKGIDFSMLARTYSDSPSKIKGGDLGRVVKGGPLDSELEQAIFALEVGETSALMDTARGYQIVHRYE